MQSNVFHFTLPLSPDDEACVRAFLECVGQTYETNLELIIAHVRESGNLLAAIQEVARVPVGLVGRVQLEWRPFRDGWLAARPELSEAEGSTPFIVQWRDEQGARVHLSVAMERFHPKPGDVFFLTGTEWRESSTVAQRMLAALARLAGGPVLLVTAPIGSAAEIVAAEPWFSRAAERAGFKVVPNDTARVLARYLRRQLLASVYEAIHLEGPARDAKEREADSLRAIVDKLDPDPKGKLLHPSEMKSGSRIYITSAGQSPAPKFDGTVIDEIPPGPVAYPLGSPCDIPALSAMGTCPKCPTPVDCELRLLRSIRAEREATALADVKGALAEDAADLAEDRFATGTDYVPREEGDVEGRLRDLQVYGNSHHVQPVRHYVMEIPRDSELGRELAKPVAPRSIGFSLVKDEPKDD